MQRHVMRSTVGTATSSLLGASEAVGAHCPEEQPERPPDCFMCDLRDAGRHCVLVGSRLLRRHAQIGSYLTCTIRSG